MSSFLMHFIITFSISILRKCYADLLSFISQIFRFLTPQVSCTVSPFNNFIFYQIQAPKGKKGKKGKKSKSNEQQESSQPGLSEALSPSKPSTSGKVLIRPSKLGAIGTENKEPETDENCPFSRPGGKRQIKPSFKLKESASFSITPTKFSAESTPKNSPLAKSESAKSSPISSAPATPIAKAKKPIIRESKLVLNQKLLERLRKPSHQVEFYSAIQRSLQSADKVPPKLVEGSNMINPGTLNGQKRCLIQAALIKSERKFVKMIY